MLKSWIILFLALISSLTDEAQDTNVTKSKNQNIAIATTNFDKANADTINKIKNLVNKLANNKNDTESNADIVGSIIQYKDKAVLPLTNFIDSSKEIGPKYGAVFTLYLIGIESLVPYSGGYYNHFINQSARKALLHCLYDKSICNAVLEQLIEDPWMTDIPVFMEYLSKPNVDYIKVLNALKSYSFKASPLLQKPPLGIGIVGKKIEIKAEKTLSSDQEITFTLIAIESIHDPNTVFDGEILKSPEWKESQKEYDQQKNYMRLEKLGDIIGINIMQSEYTENKYFFCFANKKMTVYGPVKAREIWLNWWQNLSKNEKAKFYDEKNPSLFSHPR